MSPVDLKPRWRTDDGSVWGRYEPVPPSRPRPWEDSYELIETVAAEPIAGRDVMKFARVMHVTPYLALRERPDKAAPEIAQLKFNDRVFVVRALSTPSAWSFVVTDDRRFGYVWDEWLFVDPPEPNAWLHKIAPGESAIGIAERYYKGATGWGHDYRFYVNVLVYTNRGEGDKRKGISKDNKDDSWSATKTKAGVYIWVPSVAFADTLRGRVSSGSITYGAWEFVRDLAAKVWDWATFGVAFVAGLIHGALECVWDTLTGIVDLANLIVDLVKVVLEGPIAKARELWDALSLDAIKEAIGDWIDDFEKKWNASSSLKRGHFRGWVVGYLIAEVAIAIFTAGTVTAVKWAGRLGRIVKALKKIKGLGKVIDKAEEVAKRAKGKLDDLLNRKKHKPTTTPRKFEYPTQKWMRQKLDDYEKRAGRTWKSTDDIDHTLKKHAHGSPGKGGKLPEEWTNDDILEAGYRVANDPSITPVRGREPTADVFVGRHRGEVIQVQVDRATQRITSVSPPAASRARIDPDYEAFVDADDDPGGAVAPAAAVAAPATIGFEFDLNFGVSQPVFDKRVADMPSGATFPRDGDPITDHADKDGAGNLADGFHTKRDASRLEIATVPIKIDDDKTFTTVARNVIAFARELENARGKVKADRDITVSGISGHPVRFNHPRTVISRFPLVVAPRGGTANRSWPSDTGVWAAPQATVTILLEHVGELIDAIAKSVGTGLGTALSGPRRERLGVRSDIVVMAKQRVLADRAAKIGSTLSDRSTVTNTDYSPAVAGLLMLMTSYMLSGEIVDSEDYEFFAKSYLPINVKAPFRDLFRDALSTREKLVVKELYFDKPENFFALAKDGATAQDRDNELFPDRVRGPDLDRFHVHRPTWGMLLENTVNDIPLKVTKDNTVAKKHHARGDEVLFAPISTIIPFAVTKPRVALELRRIGFASHSVKFWLPLMKTIRGLTRRLNP